MSRFDRQTILTGFGVQGQQRLAGARVLVVGAGGLGCPSLLYLSAAGVGHIGIADGDSISESNLNRQTLFGQDHIGKPKAETAASVLQQKYPDIKFNVIPSFLTPENCLDTLQDYDLVLDGTDNFGTRYMINDACVLLGIPLIMGAIYQYEGQVAVFNHGPDSVNYRDIYPVPPGARDIPNCSDTGVLGVLPGMIGTLQAAEAIKLLSGVGEVLSGKLLLYNLKSAGFTEIGISPNKASRKEIPGSREAFQQRDYQITCGLAEDISWEAALDWKRNLDSTRLIDIREPGEAPILSHPEVEHIPMSALLEQPGQLEHQENIILFCRSGQRSRKLAATLKTRFPGKKIFSVEGGILHPTSPLKQEPYVT